MTRESLAVLKERMIGLKNKTNERVINYPRKKNFKKALVAGTLGLSLALGSAGVPTLNPNITTVEAAKKDKKKPKIKMRGKKKYTVEEGENITIPKTTYSDNVTKKKKLKVAVTVKKGKKNYKSLAKKIRKATLKSKPVTIKFNDEGTYKITTTVTDLAKNKATATRYITVNEKEEIIEEEKIDTKENPTTEKVTTEQKTTEKKTTETPTTEKTTEEPKKEESTTVDLSKYADYDTVEVNGHNYNIVTKLNAEPKTYYSSDYDDYFTLEYGDIVKFSDMQTVEIGIGTESPFNNVELFPLYFLGKITLTDSYSSGNKLIEDDLSKNILLDFKYDENRIKIYAVTNNGDFLYIEQIIFIKDNFSNLDVEKNNYYSFDLYKSYSIDSDNELIITPADKDGEYQCEGKKYTLKNIYIQRED